MQENIIWELTALSISNPSSNNKNPSFNGYYSPSLATHYMKPNSFCRCIENKNIGEHFQQKNSEIKWIALKYVGYPFGLSFFLKTNIQILNEIKKKTINEYI
jgi:hypothetical protein